LSVDGTWATPPVELGEPGPEVELAVQAGPRQSLVVTRGPALGERYELAEGTTSAGRALDNEIFLDDVTVSRHHAQFIVGRGGEAQVRDVGSLNGTYVNADRIESRSLKSGDQVQIGKFRFQYLAGH
jgi:pSer/pThr/pTyr-binding forkhead associated (FHA) protein